MTEENGGRRPSDELLAMVAEDLAGRQERDESVRAALEVLRRVGFLAAELDGGAVAPAALRERASLVMRCEDCGRGSLALPVAYVLIAGGDRPLMWARQKRGEPGSWGFLDDGFWGDVAYCRRRKYVLPAEIVLAALTGGESEIRLRH